MREFILFIALLFPFASALAEGKIKDVKITYLYTTENGTVEISDKFLASEEDAFLHRRPNRSEYASKVNIPDSIPAKVFEDFLEVLSTKTVDNRDDLFKITDQDIKDYKDYFAKLKKEKEWFKPYFAVVVPEHFKDKDVFQFIDTELPNLTSYNVSKLDSLKRAGGFPCIKSGFRMEIKLVDGENIKLFQTVAVKGYYWMIAMGKYLKDSEMQTFFKDAGVADVAYHYDHNALISSILASKLKDQIKTEE